MGGIKNKLSKLSNKAKNLLTNNQFLPLDGEGGRQSLPDEVTKAKGFCFNKSNPQSALTGCHGIVAHLASRCAPTRRATGTTPLLRKGAQDLLWDQRRQMKSDRISIGGFDRLVRITKYTSLACLTLAILSTLVLNIVSSYSHSSIHTNAVDDSSNANNASTLADSNTTSISLSFTNDDGTVDKDHVIASLPSNKSFQSPTVLSNNTWGVALPNTTRLSCVNSDNCTGTRLGNNDPDDPDNPDPDDGPPEDLSDPYKYIFSSDDYYVNEDLLDQALFASIPSQTGFTTNVILTQRGSSQIHKDVYYGVRVDNPSELLAGNYTAGVVYTVIAELYPEPAVTSIANPNEGNSNNVRVNTTSQTITVHGSNLDTASRVYVDDRGTDRECTLIGSPASASLSCTLPVLSTVGDNYHVIVETKGGSAYGTINVIPPIPTIISISPSEINADSDNEILTVTGTNLATTSDIYVDFSNMQVMDDGEECVIDQSTITDTEVKCTAPRHSASNTLPVGLVTKGGVAYKTNAVKYVESLSVTRVSPSGVCASMKGYTATFTIYGAVLGEVTDVVIVGDSRLAPMLESTCDITSNIGSQITCRTTWQYGNEYATEPQMIMKLYNGSEELYTINDFALVNPC